MPKTNLFIVRHGETDFNKIGKMQGRGVDRPLNETGRQQARATAAYLLDHGIDLAVSSSLKRSRETAGIIAGEFELPVESFKELDEMDFGIYEGEYAEEVMDELKTFRERWQKGEVHLALEGGESPAQVLKRVRGRMEAILEQHAGKNILVVLHGRLIRILLSYWLGYGLEQMQAVPHSNGAIYHLRWNAKAFEIVCLNKTDHLSLTVPGE